MNGGFQIYRSASCAFSLNWCKGGLIPPFCIQYRKDDWIKWLGEGVQAEVVVIAMHIPLIGLKQEA